jgi:hypothetical protein
VSVDSYNIPINFYDFAEALTVAKAKDFVVAGPAWEVETIGPEENSS